MFIEALKCTWLYVFYKLWLSKAPLESPALRCVIVISHLYIWSAFSSKPKQASLTSRGEMWPFLPCSTLSYPVLPRPTPSSPVQPHPTPSQPVQPCPTPSNPGPTRRPGNNSSPTGHVTLWSKSYCRSTFVALSNFQSRLFVNSFDYSILENVRTCKLKIQSLKRNEYTIVYK